jgi:uncharacterized protein YutE (UPF0331/DUF86 family)
MDRRVIADKLERLRRCMQRIEHKRPPTLATLAADVDLQDILSVNLERAVLLCVDIAAHIIASREVPAPTTMAAAFDALHALHVLSPDLANSMKKSRRFQKYCGAQLPGD